jgi:hypothetical protein
MANVSVSNTTGLYIGSGAAAVLNNAQQLLSLLSNNGGVVFSLDPTTSNTKVQANAQSGGSGNYGNSNVAAFLPTYTGALTSLTGAVTTTANVQGAYILGNGSQLTGLAATYSNSNVAAFLPTYTGAMTSMTGAVTTTANVQGAYILGNGSQLTGITTNYSNANVAAYLPTYTGAITSMTGNVTTTANIQGAFILGNGSQLTGITAGSNYSNTNVAAFLPTYTGAITSMTGNVTTTANIQGGNIITSGTGGNIAGANYITANFFVGNGSLLTGIAAGSTYSNTNVAAFLPTYTGAMTSMTGAVTTTANVQGAFILGNGSQLTGITTNYSNANVAAFLPTYTGAMTSMTGNVTTTANVQGAYIIGNGAALTSVAAATAVTATSAGVATSVTGNAQANITSVGTLSSLTVTGNITSSSGVFLGNGALLTGITATTANTANIAKRLQDTSISELSNISINTSTGEINFYAEERDPSQQASNFNFYSIATNSGSLNVFTQQQNYGNVNMAAPLTVSNTATVTGNLTAANVIVTGTGGNIAGANYVSANFFAGNGSLLTGITSTYGNANVAAYLPTYTGAMTSMTGNVITTANVQGAYILGNGSQLTGLAATYSNTNVAAFLPTYTGAMTAMTGAVTTTANVTGSYFIGNGSQLTGISGGNATPGGSSTFIQYNNAGSFDGSANLIYNPTDGNITLGNLVFNKNYNRILQTNAFDTTVQSSSQNATGQFIVGDGWNGNVTSPNFNNSSFMDGAFALINKSYTKSDNGRRSAGLGLQTFVNVTANMTNSGTRVAGIAQNTRLGGNTTQTVVNATTFVGINNTLTVGGGSGTFATLGNANLRVVAGTTSGVSPQVGSFVGNAFGYISNLEGTANGQFLDRMTNYSIWSPSNYTTPGAFYGYHMPNNSAYAGISINSGVRQAADYYFLYNEDDVAQVRLGSLRRYTEYRANITSSGGNLTVDKNTAQVQYLTPTENVTAVNFTNFIGSASDGANNDSQADTVTLIVQQGATPYSITMPTGSDYKYAGNVRTVGNTANSVTMISTTVTQNVSGGTQLFLITISPEFV